MRVDAFQQVLDAETLAADMLHLALVLFVVMLEGVMATVLSNVLGFLFGSIFTIYIYTYLSMFLYIKQTIAWWAFGVGLAASTLVIFGSIYASLKDLPICIVDDLKLEE